MFFWSSQFFYDPTDDGDLISGSLAFSKSSLNIRIVTYQVEGTEFEGSSLACSLKCL